MYHLHLPRFPRPPPHLPPSLRLPRHHLDLLPQLLAAPLPLHLQAPPDLASLEQPRVEQMLSSAAIDHPTIGTPFAQRLQHQSSAHSASGTPPPSRPLVSPPASPTSPPTAPSLRSFARTPRAATPRVELGVMSFPTDGLTTHMKSRPLDSSAVTSSATSPPSGSRQREQWKARPNLLALLKTARKMMISWHTWQSSQKRCLRLRTRASSRRR